MPSPRKSQQAEWDELYLELSVEECQQLTVRALRLLTRRHSASQAPTHPPRQWIELLAEDVPAAALVIGGSG